MHCSQLTLAALAAGLCTTMAGAEEYVITLEGAKFVYNGQSNLDIDLTLQPGDSIRWVWVSGQHNVVSGDHGDPDEGQEFNSGDPVPPPEEFVHVFNTPGTFRYHCDLHFLFGMISEVTVAEACTADFNGDGTVNTQDVLAFLNAWTAKDPRADFNGDGTINTQDVLAFLNAWTTGC